MPARSALAIEALRLQRRQHRGVGQEEPAREALLFEDDAARRPPSASGTRRQTRARPSRPALTETMPGVSSRPKSRRRASIDARCDPAPSVKGEAAQRV